MDRLKSRVINLSLRIFIGLRFNFGIYLLLIKVIEVRSSTDGYLAVTSGHKWRNESFLVFNKTGLMEDLSTVMNLSNVKLPNLVVIPRFFVNILAEQFLSHRQRQDFLPKSEYDEQSHREYQNIWEYLLGKLSVKFQTKLLITANYTYGNQRDIYETAKSCNWEVVVLYKECFMSKANASNRVELLANARPFAGTKLLVYNSVEVDRQLSTGNIELEQITVTGSPRFDSLILQGEKMIEKSKGKIIFFAQDYISNLNFWQLTKEQILFSEKHNMQIVFGLNSILRAAEKYPKLHFEIKSKVTLVTQEVITDWAKNKVIPKNLKITLGGGLAKNSLENCVAAFGFNTTALVDALAVGAKIAILRHGIDEEKFADFLIPYDGAQIICDYLDLVNWIEQLLTDVRLTRHFRLKLSESDLNYLDQSVGNPDCRSSYRVLTELIRLDSKMEQTSTIFMHKRTTNSQIR